MGFYLASQEDFEGFHQPFLLVWLLCSSWGGRVAIRTFTNCRTASHQCRVVVFNQCRLKPTVWMRGQCTKIWGTGGRSWGRLSTGDKCSKKAETQVSRADISIFHRGPSRSEAWRLGCQLIAIGTKIGPMTNKSNLKNCENRIYVNGELTSLWAGWLRFCDNVK